MEPSTSDQNLEPSLDLTTRSYRKTYGKIKEIVTQKTDNVYGQLDQLLKIEGDLYRSVYRAESPTQRSKLEDTLDACYKLAAELSVSIQTNSDDLYYPTRHDTNFSQRLSELPELQPFTIPPITKNSFTEQRSGEFSKTPSQKFVSTFISPDTPYNGVLLWHGVGVGKTCSTISIAEKTTQHYRADGKKVLIITPSEQLHDTWKQEIFNLSKEKIKRQYNEFIREGYQASFKEWSSQDLKNSTLEHLAKYKLPSDQTYYAINNIQCTGDAYNPYIKSPNVKDNDKKLRSEVRKLIEEAYEFKTYNTVANDYLKRRKRLDESGINLPLEGEMVKYVKKMYSNRLIVMDEAHRLRDDDGGSSRGKSKDGKKIRGKGRGKQPDTSTSDKTQTAKQLKSMVFKMIARYTQNTKLVLLTATPMWSSSTEILDLLNLLRLNDHQPLVKTSDIFDKDKNVTEDGVEVLRRASTGYISFLRGENPTVFPVRLDPRADLLENRDTLTPSVKDLGYYPRPIYPFRPATKLSERVPIPPENWIHQFYLYRNEMQDYQWAIWVLICRHLGTKGVPWSFSGFLQNTPPTHASIVTFPTFDPVKLKELLEESGPLADPDDTIAKLKKSQGSAGFEATFERNPDDKYTFRDGINQNFLDILPPEGGVGINQYSIKMYNIMRLVNNSKGIVFIYSEYVADGVNVLAMALERNGYRHYAKEQEWDETTDEWVSDKNNDMLARDHFPETPNKRNYNGRLFSELSSDQPKRQGRFVVLKGEDMAEEQVNAYLKEVRGEGPDGVKNEFGEHIKIIIGSRKIREGFSLHRVRQIHIMDPWYHLNALDQAIGRGIRNKSHILLPAEERNVMVFIHSATMKPITSEDQLAEQHRNLQDVITVPIQQLTDEFQESVGLTDPSQVPESNLTLLETSDEYMYRTAYREGVRISKVGRILQRNAIDCSFNKHVNTFPRHVFDQIGVNPTQLLTFQGKLLQDYHIGNLDGSWKCDFDSCEYECDGSQQNITSKYPHRHIQLVEPETDRVTKIKIAIKELYSEQYAYNLEALYASLAEKLDAAEVTPKIFYQGLTEIVDNQETVQSNQTPGYLIYRAGKVSGVGNDADILTSYYIFQPRWESYLGYNQYQDETLPMSLRQLPTMVQQNSTELDRPDTVESDNGERYGEPSHDTVEGGPTLQIEQLRSSLLALYGYLKVTYSRYYPAIPPGGIVKPGHYAQLDTNHEPSSTLCIPTMYDLYLMAGFSILDSLESDEELVFLQYLLPKLIIRTETQQDSDINVTINPESEPTRQDICPTLEAVGYYFYLGTLPEKVAERRQFQVGQYVEYQDVTSAVVKKLKVTTTDPENRVVDLVDVITHQTIPGISWDLLSLPVNPSNSVMFAESAVLVDGTVQLQYVPTYVRIVIPDGIQRVYLINTTITDGVALCELTDDLSSITLEQQQHVSSLTLKHAENYSDLGVGNDVAGQYQSLVVGYYNPRSDTSRCSCIKRPRLSKVFPELTFWTSKLIEEYLLTCFYVSNLLKASSKAGSTKKTAKEGACGLTGGKAAKTETINTLLGSSCENLRKFNFFHYPRKKKGTAIGVKSITDKYPDLVREYPDLRNLSLTISSQISDTNVSFETMLLLRFFRFVGKGITEEYPLRKWFFRKSEMYFAWSNPFGQLPVTFPVPGKGNKKK